MQAGPGYGLQSTVDWHLAPAKSDTAVMKGGAESLAIAKEVTTATGPPAGRGLRGVARGGGFASILSCSR